MSIIHWSLDAWLDNVALAALSSKETLLTTYDLALNVIECGIPGDLVECGVYGGAQCAAMARAIMEMEKPTRRRVHLFDSFEGMPAPGPEDTEWIAAGHPLGISLCSLEAVKDHMTEWGIPEELLVYHPGWFEDTLPLAGHGPIALLRLDGDLYASTKLCLKHLYYRLAPGGWMIVDDFVLNGTRRAVEEFMQGNYPPVYWQKPRPLL